MKKRIAFVSSLAMIAAVGLSVPAYASPLVAQYGSNLEPNGGITDSTNSPWFANSSTIITVKGWQDTGTSTEADCDYSIWERSSPYPVQTGNTIEEYGNVPSSGSWFTAQWTGVQPTSGQGNYYLQVLNLCSATDNVGGNIYDGT